MGRWDDMTEKDAKRRIHERWLLNEIWDELACYKCQHTVCYASPKHIQCSCLCESCYQKGLSN